MRVDSVEVYALCCYHTQEQDDDDMRFCSRVLSDFLFSYFIQFDCLPAEAKSHFAVAVHNRKLLAPRWQDADDIVYNNFEKPSAIRFSMR